MKSIQAPLFELPAFLTLNKELEKPSSCVQVDGCTGSEKLHLMDACGADFRSRILVTYSDLRAKELLEDARFYDRNVLLYPAKDLIFYQADIHGNEITRERMRCLRRLIEGGELTVITTFSALMTPQIPLSVVKKHVFSVEKEKQLELSETARKLTEMGYEKVYQVEAPGQFAIRGDILDVFDLTAGPGSDLSGERNDSGGGQKPKRHRKDYGRSTAGGRKIPEGNENRAGAPA